MGRRAPPAVFPRTSRGGSTFSFFPATEMRRLRLKATTLCLNSLVLVDLYSPSPESTTDDHPRFGCVSVSSGDGRWKITERFLHSFHGFGSRPFDQASFVETSHTLRRRWPVCVCSVRVSSYPFRFRRSAPFTPLRVVGCSIFLKGPKV
jgi:hypothetical protein